MRYKNLLPVATLTALALAVPTAAYAGGKHKPEPQPTPVISVSSDPQCDGFSLTAAFDGKKPKTGTYEVTAQVYDSETVTPVGEAEVFAGSIKWGETIEISIDPATDYLLWTYRVDAVNSPKAKTVYGERQLDCRPVEQPEPEPEPEEPGDETPEAPEEPGDETPDVPEVEEPETPEAPETPEVETPEVPTTEPTTPEVVTTETTSIGEPASLEKDDNDAPTPVVATPSFTG